MKTISAYLYKNKRYELKEKLTILCLEFPNKTFFFSNEINNCFEDLLKLGVVNPIFRETHESK